jgi:uncharacterized protein YciI
MHYILTYEFSAAYATRRGEYRQRHLDYAWAAVERGELLLGGAVGEPISQALLVFTVDSPGTVEQFAQADPYVTSGLVKDWSVKPWHTVVGAAAANPIKRVGG